MDEKFRKAEEEYFILRGKLDTGRIGPTLFELALRDLMIQDAQGRWWMLGPGSGNWYMHDGKSWAEADPAHVQVAETATTPVPPTLPGSSSAPPGGSSKLPLFAAIGCVVIICLALAIFGGFSLLNLNLRPGSSVNAATLAALRSPVLFTTPTLANAPTATMTLSPAPTETFFPTETRIRSATATASPAFPPGVYVTGIRIDPSSPKRRQDVTFFPTFLNSTGAVQNYRMLVYIYRPDQNRPMGESYTNNTAIPVGTSEQQSPGWILTGPGGCEDFVVRVAWVDDQKRPTLFTRPTGQVYEQPMMVCP